jgi:hypothetical protein
LDILRLAIVHLNTVYFITRDLKMAAAKNETDIRIQFKHFDDCVLINIDDVRQLIGASSTGAVYAAVYRGDLPQPLIKRNRQLRWSAGQMRCHLQTLESDFKKRESDVAAGAGADIPTEVKKRFGRPRKEVRPFSI